MRRVFAFGVVALLAAGCGDGATQPAARTTATDASNLAATKSEVSHLLDVIAPPLGTKVLRHPQSAGFRRLDLGIDIEDPALTRAVWWTVPMKRGAFAHWIQRQRPAGLTGARSESNIDGQIFNSWNFAGASTSAYTAPTLNVSYAPYGDGTAVRLETFLAARSARNTFVPTDMTQVHVVRTTMTMTSTLRSRRSVTVTDEATVQRLVDLANRLDGVPNPSPIFTCPIPLHVSIYTVDFVGPSGTFSVSESDPCPQHYLTLLRDGRPVNPLLDGGTNWLATLPAFFAGS